MKLQLILGAFCLAHPAIAAAAALAKDKIHLQWALCDRDAAAVQEARAGAGANCHFLLGDMRDLADVPGDFDAVVILWQSFGYFDDATNAAVLR